MDDDQTSPAQKLYSWLIANLGERCLAPLTGTDSRALQAALHVLELYAYDGDSSLLAAFRIVVHRMQPKNFGLAYHAIAHVLDWRDRSRIWIAAGLPEFAPGRCAMEP